MNKIVSARGEVTDKWRGLVRDILDQVPSYVKVPVKEQGVKKEVFGEDHLAYSYTEKIPGENGPIWVTTEFHVDPSDGYTTIYVQNEYDGHNFLEMKIEDLEDYNLSEIDRIDTAIQEAIATGTGKEGAHSVSASDNS